MKENLKKPNVASLLMYIFAKIYILTFISDKSGRGLFPTVAILSHSCYANLGIFFVILFFNTFFVNIKSALHEEKKHLKDKYWMNVKKCTRHVIHFSSCLP